MIVEGIYFLVVHAKCEKGHFYGGEQNRGRPFGSPQFNQLPSNHSVSFFHGGLAGGRPCWIWGRMSRSDVMTEYVSLVLSYNDTAKVFVSLALGFFDHIQKCRSLVLELGRQLNVFSLVLLQGFFVHLLDGLVFVHLFQTVWSWLVVYSTHGGVTFSRFSVSCVLDMLIFDGIYSLFWCIGIFTSTLPRFFDGNIKDWSKKTSMIPSAVRYV